jgi:HAD superfamily hydrolase (TIGR01459 family)
MLVSSPSCDSERLNSDPTYNILTNIHDILDKYDYFIIDQWGVLHNGKVPYKGVIEALEVLKRNNKILILLSNSSKQKSSSHKGLQKVGIEPSYFTDIVTSGELGFHIIKNKVFYNNNKMQNYFVIGNNDDDVDYIKNADCCITSISQADVVLVRGTFSILTSMSPQECISYKNPHELLSNIDSWLEECRRYDLPMLITNPDFYRPGNNEPMP